MAKSSGIILSLIVLVFLSTTATGQIPNIQISSPSGQLQNEEQVFFCPTDGNYLIANWRDFRLGYRRCGIGRSTDGGVTWTDQLNNLMMDMDSRQSDPTLTVDAQGNFYCCFLDYSSNTFMEDSSFIVFTKSTDKGLTWTGPYPVSTSHGPWFEDKQFITADRTGGVYDGSIYVAWARFPNPTRMLFARSIDGGITFEDTLIVGPSQDHEPCGGILDAGQFAQPIVGSDGSVYVFWSGNYLYPDECEGYYTMKMSKSTDGGQTWPTQSVPIFPYNYVGSVDGGINVYNAPAGDADIFGGPYDGNIYISTTNGHDDGIYYHADIEVIKSTDGGDTWLPPVRANDDPLMEDTDQFHPWLIVNQDGVIVMIFYDQRMDPFHYEFDVFGAYSFDGGETFTTNHRITDVSSSPSDLKKTGTPFDPAEDNFDDAVVDEDGVIKLRSPMAGLIAEYIGVTADHDDICAVWTDARNGNQDVFAAYYSIPFLEPRLFGIADEGYIGNDLDSLFWSTSWHEGNISYRIEIDDDPLFGSIDVSAVLTDNKFYSTSLGLGDGEYYWRVKAFRTAEVDSSDYSNVWSFNIDTGIPVMPTPDPSSDGILTDNPTPTLIWTLPKGPDEAEEFYEVEVSADPAFSGTPPYFHYDGISVTTFVMPDSFPMEATYFWHVNHYDLAGNESGYSVTASIEYVEYICGDANGDLTVNVGDAVFLISYVFSGGPPPDPLEAGDANLDGTVNVGDAVYLIAYIFLGGTPPCEPI
jgi:hypothetical protein